MQDDFDIDRGFSRQRALLIGFLVLLAVMAGACLVMKRPAEMVRDPRCDGPARYEAMREAYEAGRPQPC